MASTDLSLSIIPNPVDRLDSQFKYSEFSSLIHINWMVTLYPPDLVKLLVKFPSEKLRQGIGGAASVGVKEVVFLMSSSKSKVCGRMFITILLRATVYK